MPAVKRLLVLGNGLATAACALAAIQAGAVVDVARTVADVPDGPEATHVPPNMMRALVALGVAPACIAAGFPYRGLTILHADGQVASVSEARRLAGPLWPAALGISRALLADILWEAALRLGARICAPAQCIGVEMRRGAVHAAFDDGRLRRYGLVVAASAEAARSIGAAASATTFLGECLWTAVVPRPTLLDQPLMMPGIPGIPAGRALALPISERRAGILMTAPGGDAPLPIDGRARTFRHHLRGMSGPLARPREQIVDDLAVEVRPIRAGLQPSPWYRQGVLRLGSAAHAVAPHLGQADAQDFEDAMVLGALLRESRLVADIAAAFEQRRFARSAEAVALAHQAAQWLSRPMPHTDFTRLIALQQELVATLP